MPKWCKYVFLGPKSIFFQLSSKSTYQFFQKLYLMIGISDWVKLIPLRLLMKIHIMFKMT